jgi:hypothetical protein
MRVEQMHTSEQISELLLGRYEGISKGTRCSGHQWEHCFRFFAQAPVDVELASLHLAFYLASWGMYRGSAKVRDFDYLIHKPIVKEVLRSKYDPIRNASLDALTEHLDNLLWPLAERIRGLYPRPITVTDTLVTKILLGTLGCSPAYDTNFVAGIGTDGIARTFSKKGFRSLLSHCTEHSEGFLKAQKQIRRYPMMRLVDMYYFAVGKEKLK